MPFTPAHVAAVRPLARWGLPTSALVVGSMAPDFPHYVPGAWRWLPVRSTHSLLGVVTVDLLLGAAGLLLWHVLLAPLLVQAAPPQWRARFSRIGQGRSRVPLTPPGGLTITRSRPRPSATDQEPANPVAGLLLVVAGLMAGSVTHVVWDEFTHARRFGDRHVPGFGSEWAGLPGWQWAQFASGVLGLAVTWWWVRDRWRASADDGRRRLASGRGSALRRLPADGLLPMVARTGLLAAGILGAGAGIRAGLTSTGVSGLGYAVATSAGAAATAVVLPVAFAVRVGMLVRARREAVLR